MSSKIAWRPPKAVMSGLEEARGLDISLSDLDQDVQSSESPGQSSDAEDAFPGDQDEAETIMQPTISPIATRLTSPRTPAAEKAAALERMPGGGLFHSSAYKDADACVVPSQNPSSPPSRGRSPNKLNMPRNGGLTSEKLPATQPKAPSGLPAPWRAGPRDLVVQHSRSGAGQSTKSSVFGGSSARHQRSTSVGDGTLRRRLSKALPSITIPAGFFPNLPTPLFFTSGSANESSPRRPLTSIFTGSSENSARLLFLSSPQKGADDVRRKRASSFFSTETPGSVRDMATKESDRATANPYGSNGRSSATSRKSHAHVLRKTASDESLLYSALTRMPSLDDEERFSHIREQVNSRFKAIKDSFDGPSFKMPQLPSIASPLRKPSLGDNLAEPSRMGAPYSKGVRSSRDGLPAVDAAIEALIGDVVILGGYRGSILRSARPPHRQLWVPVKVGLKIRQVNLEVGLNPEDEEQMEKNIFASGMLQRIGPVDISRRLFKKLRDSENAKKGELRVWDFAYDWRLSPHLSSRKLMAYLERLPCNQPETDAHLRGALVIAHSLGGLITRHAVNQRPDLFSGVIYAGVPQRCISILGPLRNGDPVLLNEKVLTAQVNFSLRTTFVFLPEDGFCFVDKQTREEYPVDFYNVEDWVKHRLCPCVGEPALPPLLSPRSSTFSSLLSIPDSLASLPLRSRSNSNSRKDKLPYHAGLPATRDVGCGLLEGGLRDRTLAPQMESSVSATERPSPKRQASLPTQARNMEYLARTLADTKRFRAELAHRRDHQEANAYPPMAVMYTKDIPTVYAARVSGREGIACADSYDDLVFRGGDGVVLARESMLPPGYELVRGGLILTDRGHVTLLGDLPSVGRAIEAVVRGRRKGIGLVMKTEPAR